MLGCIYAVSTGGNCYGFSGYSTAFHGGDPYSALIEDVSCQDALTDNSGVCSPSAAAKAYGLQASHSVCAKADPGTVPAGTQCCYIYVPAPPPP